tara:strand:+ start:1528 stop:1929 length:402 start_codon:yes stop_codon:yes gene_type:complete
MPHTDLNDVKLSSNRSFGLVFFVVFLIISLWPIISEEPIRIWSAVISIIFLILGIINSKLLTPLNKIWFKFGILLGNIVSPIVMGILFFAVVTPTGLILRVFGKDLLGKKFDKEKKSYWIKRETPVGSMKRQF